MDLGGGGGGNLLYFANEAVQIESRPILLNEMVMVATLLETGSESSWATPGGHRLLKSCLLGSQRWG